MLRVLFSASNIVFSFALGLLACGFVLINYPETMAAILGGAAGFKVWLTGLGLPAAYNNWVIMFLGEAQLVLMGFTIATRLAVSILLSFAMWVFGWGDARRNWP